MYRSINRLPIVTLLMIVLLGLAFLPIQSIEAQDAPIRVGSKTFAENEILANIIMVTLENAGFVTVDMTNIDISTDVVRAALINNQIDVYAEYTGTAYASFFANVDWFTFDPTLQYNEVLVYGMVSSLDAIVNDLLWLAPAPANNAYGIAVQRSFAEANGLNTMSDFAAYVNNGGEVLLVGSDFFVGLDEALPAFEQVYGFELDGGQLLVITDVTTLVAQRAVSEGVNGVNASMAYTTDGALTAYDLVLLQDDLKAQPAFQPAPVFRGELLRQNPEIAGLLNPVFTHLDENILQSLNVQVEAEGLTAREVATVYLENAGFIGDGILTE